MPPFRRKERKKVDEEEEGREREFWEVPQNLPAQKQAWGKRSFSARRESMRFHVCSWARDSGEQLQIRFVAFLAYTALHKCLRLLKKHYLVA